MKLCIILITATLATLFELHTVNGYVLWSPSVKMCLNRNMDLFCGERFRDTAIITKTDVDPQPTNVRNVTDECCKTACTVRYIYETYCVNRTSTSKRHKREQDKSKNDTKETTTPPGIPSGRVITSTEDPDKLPRKTESKTWWYPVGVGPWIID